MDVRSKYPFQHPAAAWTGIAVQRHIPDGKPVAFDEELAAIKAARIFPGASGDVPHIDIFEPRLPADLTGATESRDGGGRPLCHLILGMEAADMPGGFRAE